MKSFREIAQESTALCPLMVGKEKLNTEQIINQPLTVIAFDFAEKRNRDTGKIEVDPLTGEVLLFGVVVFREMPEFYYTVGTVMTKICEAWLSEYSSLDDANAALVAEGGVPVKFTRTTTRGGNNLTKVEIL